MDMSLFWFSRSIPLVQMCLKSFSRIWSEHRNLWLQIQRRPFFHPSFFNGIMQTIHRLIHKQSFPNHHFWPTWSPRRCLHVPLSSDSGHQQRAFGPRVGLQQLDEALGCKPSRSGTFRHVFEEVCVCVCVCVFNLCLEHYRHENYLFSWFRFFVSLIFSSAYVSKWRVGPLIHRMAVCDAEGFLWTGSALKKQKCYRCWDLFHHIGSG